ncbi:MAG: 4Fe-4S dicluster domain-containing protein [Candidatus Hydrogenedentes bacterium]|nr:4Fe-4S dicluster domain-containing protein [Candidatus Hydrogenedentota bacterium]
MSGVAIVVIMGESGAGASEEQAVGAASATRSSAYDPTKHRYIYLIDITKCIGCGACVRACEAENNVPPHYFRTWIERYMVSRTGADLTDSPNGGRDGFEPRVTGEDITKAFFVPKLCNHCSYSPCVQLCPVGASYRSPDGVILVDEKRCIGCGYCVQACPYGSRFLHPETHIASKCTLCYHRITKGLKPACVEACPVEARKFGDAEKVGDEVSELIATKAVGILKPELHTGANCYYVGLSQEVR